MTVWQTARQRCIAIMQCNKYFSFQNGTKEDQIMGKHVYIQDH